MLPPLRRAFGACVISVATPLGATCQIAQPLPPETMTLPCASTAICPRLFSGWPLYGGPIALVVTTSSLPASRRRSCIPVEMYSSPCSLRAIAAELSWSIDTERAGVPFAIGGGSVMLEQHGGSRGHAGDAGHSRDHAVRAHDPDPVPVDDVQAPVRPDRHVDDVQELRVDGRPAVTRDTLLPVAGDDAKAAVGETHQYLLAVDIGDVEGAAGGDGERAGDREIGLGAFGQPGPEVAGGDVVPGRPRRRGGRSVCARSDNPADTCPDHGSDQEADGPAPPPKAARLPDECLGIPASTGAGSVLGRSSVTTLPRSWR